VSACGPPVSKKLWIPFWGALRFESSWPL
jgi:hypothetical protein